MVSVVIVGAGRHAAVVIEAMRATGGFAIAGMLDPDPALDQVLGVKRIGSDEDLPRLRGEGISGAVIALGHNKLRCKIGDRAVAAGFSLPPVVHPAALISPSALLAEGAVVMARAVVGVESRVGRLAIINTGAIVDHDAMIGEAAHIAPGCALAGTITVGRCTLVGVGSAVRPGITIGANVVIGAGSAVVCDIPDGVTVGGVPARALRSGN